MVLTAQGPARDRIKTLKVAYITEQLGLTPTEAQSFWPVYNAHEEQLERIRKKEREKFVGVQTDMSVITDEQANDMVNSFVFLQQQKHEIEEKFIKDLRTVISNKKIILLFRAENNFKKRLLQEYRNKRGQR
ncbi:Hypothetical protein I595_77 [Croceitalea dokdonensis DOKDO 023]|uniref:Sensor of ECF-type sigma factor n=2 Tax=Croceitalea TaxID=574891 RepID=A0A0P7AHW0_9FLAO|nr:Hypothetical protein I595_77 [Croceitalea dokdonensis DOKDO 023]